LICSVANAHNEQHPIRSKLMSVQKALPARPEDADLPEMRALASSPWLSTVGAWILRGAERRALRELAEDRRQLSDVGLTREQVLRAAAKPFWRR